MIILDKIISFLTKKTPENKENIEDAIAIGLEEVIHILKSDMDKTLLSVLAPLIKILARQGRVILENGLYYFKKGEIDKGINLVLSGASEEEKEDILRLAAEGVFVAAYDQYEDRKNAQLAVSIISSFISSKIGGLL
ncbi:MAG: hypothetical protein WC967_12050 [Balneolaceae bacterium]